MSSQRVASLQAFFSLSIGFLVDVGERPKALSLVLGRYGRLVAAENTQRPNEKDTFSKPLMQPVLTPTRRET